MSALSSAIRLYELTVAYGREPALSQVTGSFATGSLTAVMGPNGAGKTTLLKAIAGLLPPGAGRVELVGADRGQVAYLPQRSEVDRTFPIAVQDVVGLGHWRRSGAFAVARAGGCQGRGPGAGYGRARGRRKAADRDAFRRQFQRVLFARLLVQDCPIVLLDEPFAAVDARTTADLLEIVRAWHQDGRTVVVVLHQVEQVRSEFPETLLLAHAVIDWGPTERVLSPRQSAARLGPARCADDGRPGVQRLRRSA